MVSALGSANHPAIGGLAMAENQSLFVSQLMVESRLHMAVVDHGRAETCLRTMPYTMIYYLGRMDH